MIFPFLIQTFLPNSDWDGAAYHLPLAKRFLEGQIFEVVPDFDTYNFPGNIHLVYAVFLALGAESAIIPFNFLLNWFPIKAPIGKVVAKTAKIIQSTFPRAM